MFFLARDLRTVEETIMDMEDIMKKGMVAMLVGFGHDLGLFKALQTLGSKCTPRSLALEANLNERYVKEWMGAMVASEIMEVNADKEYRIKGCMDSILSCSFQGELLTLFGRQIPAMKDCFSSILPKGYTLTEFQDLIPFMDAFHKENYSEEWFQKTIIPTFQILPENPTILDFGCGTGLVASVLAKKYPSAKFYGIDICQKAIKYCIETFHYPNLEFHASDTELPADWEDKFDLVMLIDVLHDLSDPVKVLTEIKKILKPKGMLLTLDPSIHSDQNLNAGDKYTIQCYLFSLMNCLPSSMSAPPHAGLGPTWGYEEKVKLLDEIGFKVLKSSVTGPNCLSNIVVCTQSH